MVGRTVTRREAGLIEVELAKTISDRTDWRQLVSADAPPLDLEERAQSIREAHPHLAANWVREEPVTLHYPVLRYGVAERLNLVKTDDCVCSRLIGCKGSYLLFEHGVFNVASHSGFEVSVEVEDNPPRPEHDDQMSLF